ncbi:hypothetical protein NM688_g802 [Phlebia brevispora]|uniref:Uncharacterized protein n=1 Tax=Phlebia brevispora TaxID=194682 RepID=A0ACC1TDJ1_9APHY|nr:hypothetical protein NM688_g802 [Phlebia brevispora]
MPSSTVANVNFFNQQVESLCTARRINLASLMVSTTPQTAAADSSPCSFCRLCNITMKGDSKTVGRHILSDSHVQKVAAVLHVNPEALLPSSLMCEWCGQQFRGARKDSLKRHEESCSMKLRGSQPLASRSYTTNDIPDSVVRAVPVRRSASLPLPNTPYASAYPQHMRYTNAPAAQNSVAFFPERLQACDFL